MDCLFCKIIDGEIKSYKIYEDDVVFAFLDVNPHGNGHTLIVPKKHCCDFIEMDNQLLNHMFSVAKVLEKSIEEKLHSCGASLCINYGDAQQIKHLHLHIIPTYRKQEKITIDEVYKLLKK